MKKHEITKGIYTDDLGGYREVLSDLGDKISYTVTQSIRRPKDVGKTKVAMKRDFAQWASRRVENVAELQTIP